MVPTLYIPRDAKLPDSDQYINRFQVRSQSSGRVYVVAQSRTKRYWSCSCPGWKRHRRCKHLETIGVPCLMKPHEVIAG